MGAFNDHFTIARRPGPILDDQTAHSAVCFWWKYGWRQNSEHRVHTVMQPVDIQHVDHTLANATGPSFSRDCRT